MNYPLLYKINCPNSKQQAYSTVFRYQQLRSLSKRFSLVVVVGRLSEDKSRGRVRGRQYFQHLRLCLRWLIYMAADRRL